MNAGDGVAALGIIPIYTYTWSIDQLLGEVLDLPVLAKDITLPTFTVVKEEVEGGSLRYKYASGVQWEDVKITFYHIGKGGGDALYFLHKWRANVWTPEFGLQGPNIYKKNSKISVYDAQGTWIYSWELIGSWPQTIKEGDLTYTSSDVKIVEVVISYDWAQLVYEDKAKQTAANSRRAEWEKNNKYANQNPGQQVIPK